MIHETDRNLSDTQIDRLADWLKIDEPQNTAFVDAVENSNFAALCAAERYYDSKHKKTFRPRCTHCGASFPTIRIAIEAPICDHIELACTECYDEFYPEPDTGRADFTDLELARSA